MKARARAQAGPTREQMRAQAFGAAIRARRKELGLTQEALGRFAGCGLAFLYELERGKPTARLDKVLDVLEILGLELRLEAGKAGLRIGEGLAAGAGARR